MDEKGRLDDDKKCCVFRALYEKVGSRQWKRVGKPAIKVLEEGDTCDNYRTPVVIDLTNAPNAWPPRVEILVHDENAVDLTRDDLLGKYESAAHRCDRILQERFAEDVILEGFSDWW